MFIERRGRREAGFSLIELIVFIVIVGVGLAGLLSVLNVTVMHSGDPMVRKQTLAIAEALMEEVMAQPFTYCDPSDANAATATSATVGPNGCAATVQGLGPAMGETRPTTTGGGPSTFNNVPDYAGLATISPVVDVSGTHSYGGYSATITITPGDALGPAGATIAPNDATAANLNLLRIGVTVAGPSGDSLTLEGYRARHSPTALP